MADIGILNEGALHAALKQDYLGDNGRAEVPFGGFVADVVRDGVIYEVQTSSFSGLGRKMQTLADLGPVVLIHPIAKAKYLLRIQDVDTGEFTRRRSPKHGALVHILRELVYLPSLLSHPNFALEVVLTEEEEVQIYDPKARRGRGGWRRRWRRCGRAQPTRKRTRRRSRHNPRTIRPPTAANTSPPSQVAATSSRRPIRSPG